MDASTGCSAVWIPATALLEVVQLSVVALLMRSAPARRYFDFDKLRDVTHVVTRNLNKIIDINYYPVETARRSNMRNRPIGIGVQARASILSRSCRWCNAGAACAVRRAPVQPVRIPVQCAGAAWPHPVAGASNRCAAALEAAMCVAAGAWRAGCACTVKGRMCLPGVPLWPS